MDRSGTEVLPGGVVIRWRLSDVVPADVAVEIVQAGPNTGQEVSVLAASVDVHDR